MHSSRMRTALLLTVSQHALPGGVPAQGVTCQGGVPAQGSALGGVCTWWGCTCPGDVPARGVYLLRGCTCPEGGPAQVLFPL